MCKPRKVSTSSKSKPNGNVPIETTTIDKQEFRLKLHPQSDPGSGSLDRLISERTNMSTVRERVIARINAEIGSDVNNLSKSRELVKHYNELHKATEAKLSVKNHHTESPVKSILSSCEAAVEAAHIEVAKVEAFTARISKQLSAYEDALDEISDPLRMVKQLEKFTEYLVVVQDITDVSNGIQSCLDAKDDAGLVRQYMSLCGDFDSADNIIGRLEYVEANHLKQFAENTAIYWYNLLVELFSKEFELILKNIKWPYLGSAAEIFNPPKEQCSKLAMLAEYLFLIKPPSSVAKNEYVAITSAILCPPISVPIQLLLKTFRQRFVYHFSGAKQTNRLDKPEWFFTQILSWAKDNHLFVASNFQAAAHLSGHRELNVRLEFVRGLVQLSIEKLCGDIDEFTKDDHLFAHLLDETLCFEQELRETLRYPSTMESALTVLTQGQFLNKWLAAEENFSTSHMDDMLKRGNPWEFIDPINLEDLKIPKCADQFVRLLDAMKERYCALPQPGHQLQFLNLQIELIDSFRRRLIQLYNSTEDSKVTSAVVLNTINYIVSVMREWGENVHYLHLHVARMGHNNDEITSVFEKPIKELEHWKGQIINELSTKIVDDIKAKSKQYRHNNWISINELSAKDVFALSPAAGEMFQLIVTVTHSLETELSQSIFNHVLRLIASRLDSFLIDGLIMNTKFSTGGADQFHFDITRNLFPLFGQYSSRPALLFKQLNDACVLLKLKIGTALLLYQSLKNEPGEDNCKTLLREIGVGTLSVRRSVDILERRNDIVTN